VGECFFWYRPTWVVPDQRPLDGCVCAFQLSQVCFCHLFVNYAMKMLWTVGTRESKVITTQRPSMHE